MFRALLCLACLMCMQAPAVTAWGEERLFGVPERSAKDDPLFQRYYKVLWESVLRAEQNSPAFTAEGAGMNAADAAQWRAILQRAARVDLPETLRMVNGFFNHWRSKQDAQAFGTPEHWASPAEFIRNRGGDCEDYAIAKYFALRFLGVPAESMRLVVLREVSAKGVPHPQLHAVLAVRTAKTWFVLDNNARPKLAIHPHTQYKSRVVPLYSMNENGAWKHAPDPMSVR